MNEDFMGVFETINKQVQSYYNTEENEMALRAYQAAALTRIANGIQQHNKHLEKQNELLEQILRKMQRS